MSYIWCKLFFVNESSLKDSVVLLRYTVWHYSATELPKSKVFLINRYDDGKYGFSEKGKMFDSIIDLVEYYRMSSLRDLFPGIDVTLQHPVPKPKVNHVHSLQDSYNTCLALQLTHDSNISKCLTGFIKDRMATSVHYIDLHNIAICYI